MNSDISIYSRAKQAIAEYKTVDEVKDFRDKALAVEAYAKQANDMELEWDAAKARVRAERKCGELLRDMEKAKASLGNQYTGKLDRSHEVTSPKTLSEMGVTKKQSSDWQRLAAVPEDEFEKAVTVPGGKPTTNHIINPKKPNPIQRVSKDSLWLWGILREMRSMSLFSKDINDLQAEWTEGMSEDVDGLIKKLSDWSSKHE